MTLKYGALVEKSQYIPTGEISPKNPYGGFPKTIYYTSLVKFNNEEEMKVWAEKHISYGEKFRLIQYEELEHKVELKITPICPKKKDKS